MSPQVRPALLVLDILGLKRLKDRNKRNQLFSSAGRNMEVSFCSTCRRRTWINRRREEEEQRRSHVCDVHTGQDAELQAWRTSEDVKFFSLNEVF